MIFATVGTQLPFPRMLKALDAIANRLNLRIVAQTCESQSSYSYLETSATISPAEFDRNMREASVIIGHAGIGTILGAGRLEKPLILFPRSASLGEHRNDHQFATVKALGNRKGISVATNETELEALLAGEDLTPFRLGEGATRPQLLNFLNEFIHFPSEVARQKKLRVFWPG